MVGARRSVKSVVATERKLIGRDCTAANIAKALVRVGT